MPLPNLKQSSHVIQKREEQSHRLGVGFNIRETMAQQFAENLLLLVVVVVVGRLVGWLDCYGWLVVVDIWMLLFGYLDVGVG